MAEKTKKRTRNRQKNKKRIQTTTRATETDLDHYDLDPLIKETIGECILLILIFFSLGFILLFLKKSDTSRSKIHGLFRPFDLFMLDDDLDPGLDRSNPRD